MSVFVFFFPSNPNEMIIENLKQIKKHVKRKQEIKEDRGVRYRMHYKNSFTLFLSRRSRFENIYITHIYSLLSDLSLFSSLNSVESFI